MHSFLKLHSWYNSKVTNEDSIYLDHAAATPIADFVVEVMRPYLSENFYNPSSPYAPAIAVRKQYEVAKSDIASVLGAKSDEIIMTAGATESINLMIQSTTGHVVTSAIEHAAVLEALRGRDYTAVAPRADGTITPEAIRAAIRPDTELVTIAYANNEIGTIQSLSDIAAVVKDERHRRSEAGEGVSIYFHSDASQGAGVLDLHVSRLGLDAITLNAGKVYGPKQVGLLWASRYVDLKALTKGGGQEQGLRSGTENVAGVVGFAKALQVAQAHRGAEAARVRALRDSLQKRLIEAFPDAVVSGNQKKQLPGFLHISFPGLDAERLLMMCEARGVLVATGSACAANKGTRSHVLTSIGLAPDVADGSLRLTLGKLSNDETIARAGDIIIDSVMAERARMTR